MSARRFSDQEVVDVFWSKVRKTKTGCWEWIGSRDRSGYGQLSMIRTETRAHRFSMSLHLGRMLKEGEWVLHHCDNPPCVRPDHLFLGTNKDNMRDMTRKGRKPKGEKAWASKLTNEEVKQIASLYQSGKWTYLELANKFDVCLNTIGFIIKAEKWNDVTRIKRKDNRQGRKMPSMNQGESSGKAKIKNKDIPQIKRLRASGWLFKDIANKYGVRSETIASMFRGKTWKHLFGEAE